MTISEHDFWGVQTTTGGEPEQPKEEKGMEVFQVGKTYQSRYGGHKMKVLVVTPREICYQSEGCERLKTSSWDADLVAEYTQPPAPPSLVERLRTETGLSPCLNMLGEAADEIEHLTADNERLASACHEQHELSKKLTAERDEACHEIKQWEGNHRSHVNDLKRIHDLRQERDALAAKLEAMEAGVANVIAESYRDLNDSVHKLESLVSRDAKQPTSQAVAEKPAPPAPPALSLVAQARSLAKRGLTGMTFSMLSTLATALADELERLGKLSNTQQAEIERLARYEKELESLAEFVKDRHLIGDVRAVGLMEAVAGAKEVVKQLTVERDEANDRYANACELVAKMHAAAVDEVRGPSRGAVEDVANLKTERDALAAKLKTLVEKAEEVAITFRRLGFSGWFIDALTAAVQAAKGGAK